MQDIKRCEAPQPSHCIVTQHEGLNQHTIARKRSSRGDYRLQFHVEEKKRTVTKKQTVKGKEVIAEKEFTDYAIVIEKIGHRDGFYEE